MVLRALLMMMSLSMWMLGCSADEGGSCGIGSAGCQEGLYCEPDDKDAPAAVVAVGEGCGEGAERFPEEGTCRVQKRLGEGCGDGWHECEGELTCIRGRCLPGAPRDLLHLAGSGRPSANRVDEGISARGSWLGARQKGLGGQREDPAMC